MKSAFYPRWYILDKEKEYEKRIKVKLIFIGIILILGFTTTYVKYIKINRLVRYVENKISTYPVENEKSLGENEVSKICEDFFGICDFMESKNFKLGELKVDEENFEMAIYIDKQEEYPLMVSDLEKKFKINAIWPTEEKGDKLIFRVKVEKNEET